MERLFRYIFFFLVLCQYSFGQDDYKKVEKVRTNIDAGLYKEAIDLAETISDNNIFNIYRDYFKAVAYYKIWEGDSLTLVNLSNARSACEYYLSKYDDENIEHYIKIVGFTNILRRRDMKEILVSDTTFIPSNPKYENALRYVAAIELYQNRKYNEAINLFKEIERGKPLDVYIEYYEVLSYSALSMNSPKSSSLKKELESKTSEYLKKYSIEHPYHNKDMYASVSKIYNSVKPVDRNKSWYAMGYEGGLIAPYGVRFDYMNKRGLGFFANVRTSFTKDQDILSENVIENKNEVIVGPAVRLFPWLYLNIGVGAGYYSSIYRNDYEGVLGTRKTNYLATYGGVTLKFGKIGIRGGVSFMDIGEALYKPEPTIGLTYQIK